MVSLSDLLNCLKTVKKGNCNGQLDHVHRRKSGLELVELSAAVMGIELCYAAETAFVSPTLLNIGLSHNYMSLIWCLSPLVGFVLSPILGSLSDRCSLSLGRRRPFIILLSLGIVLGLVLVPNGRRLGLIMGDVDDGGSFNRSSPVSTWGITFTVIGTVLLDFDSDACQAPARAYLLDCTLPQEHVAGLSTFTVMAGLGGTFGYAMGAIDWNETSFGRKMGGQVSSVFAIISFVFVICVAVTVTSFKEVPLGYSEQKSVNQYARFEDEDELDGLSQPKDRYGAINETSFGAVAVDCKEPESRVTLRHYLSSIIHMPRPLLLLCLTNFFSWMSLVSYSLYFTDFVGEAIFHGNPRAELLSPSRLNYEEGVRFGCFGMTLYSFSCTLYSMNIERLISKFGPRAVYVGGHLVYSTGMLLMGLLRHRLAVLLLSCTSGIMYSTLFTMPYLLVANYHSTKLLSKSDDTGDQQLRGLGTDVAVVNSMIFLAQFVLSSCVGTVVHLTGSTVAIVFGASIFSLCGAISAFCVTYCAL